MPDYNKLMRKNASFGGKVTQKTKGNRGFLRQAALLLIFGAALVTVCLGGTFLLKRFAGFKITKVSVTNQKGKAVSNPRNFFYLDPNSDLGLFGFKMKKIAQDIQARHPELAGVSISKQFLIFNIFPCLRFLTIPIYGVFYGWPYISFLLRAWLLVLIIPCSIIGGTAGSGVVL